MADLGESGKSNYLDIKKNRIKRERMSSTAIPRSKKIKLYFLEGFLVFLILLLGATIYLLNYQRAYAGKIYPKVQFSDINIGGKSESEATTLLRNYNTKLGKEKINIITENKKTEVTFEDAGTALDINKIIADAYGAGRDDNFFKDLLKSAQTLYKKQVIPPLIKTDQDKFTVLVDKISNDLNQKAVDAGLKIEGTNVVATPGQKGLSIDQNDLKQQITAALNSQTSKTITAKAVLSEPGVNVSDLENAKNQATSYFSKTLTLKTDDQTFTVTSAQIASWISFNRKDNIIVAEVDNNKLTSYVANTLAPKIDIAKIDRKILATTGAVISEGSNGRHLDRTDATAKIKIAVQGTLDSTVITLKVDVDIFGDQQVFPDEGIVAGRFPGKYIDIDLTHQQMYLFEGSNLIAQYTISTGKWSTPTPIGTRYILDKTPRAWSAPHGLWMPWWQSIGQGYGIHELPEWPNGTKEGEGHLGTPVSHGCIRLGVGPAQMTYNWTDIGTPVYIHK